MFKQMDATRMVDDESGVTIRNRGRHQIAVCVGRGEIVLERELGQDDDGSLGDIVYLPAKPRWDDPAGGAELTEDEAIWLEQVLKRAYADTSTFLEIVQGA